MGGVLVTPLARQDLSDIWDYLAEHSPERADKLLDLIHEKCLTLAAFPEMGRARHELLEAISKYQAERLKLENTEKNRNRQSVKMIFEMASSESSQLCRQKLRYLLPTDTKRHRNTASAARRA